MSLHHVKPVYHRHDEDPQVLVGYNGHGKPMAFIADTREVWFLTDRHHPSSASIWIVPDVDWRMQESK